MHKIQTEICAKGKKSENYGKYVDKQFYLCYTLVKIKQTEDNTMNNITEDFARTLLLYGTFKADVQLVEADGFRRIRVIELKDKKYFHHMFNGEMIECYEV